MALDLLREAIKAAHQGNREEACELLHELLIGQPRHEMGWLWLSKLSTDVEEQIQALEMVLRVNPGCEEAIYRLPELKALRQNALPADRPDLYQEAVMAHKNGRPHLARQYLQQLVQADPGHWKAWTALGRLAQTPEEKIVALEAILEIDPKNEKATAVLQRLRLNQVDKVALGQAYGAVYQHRQALAAYQYAARHADSTAERHIAHKRAQEIQSLFALATQEPQAADKQPPPTVKYTRANMTLLRLSLGPLIIYGLLLLIHGGMNPSHIPFLFYLGFPVVAVGSLLMAGAANTPHHPFWYKLFGPSGLKDGLVLYPVTALGLVLLVIPFSLVLIIAFNRLAIYREAITAAIP